MDKQFIAYLESAIDKAEQAISRIAYYRYPELNKEAIAKIREAIGLIEDAIDMDISEP